MTCGYTVVVVGVAWDGMGVKVVMSMIRMKRTKAIFKTAVTASVP